MPKRLAAALERAHYGGGLTRSEPGALISGEARELLGDAVAAAVL